MERLHRVDVNGDDLPLAGDGLRALRRDLAPAAGRGAEINDARARLQEPVLLVDLGELVGRARTEPFALRGGHIRIVELPLQPSLRGGGVPARGLEADVHLAIAAARSGRLLAARFLAALLRAALLGAAFAPAFAPTCAL